MIINVRDTNATGIHMALVEARHNIGVASSMVFTMIVIADLKHYDRALEACRDAGREHPSRIILVTNGQAKADRVDAEIRLGEEVPGEIISLKFHGELVEHRDSVVLPLLLPDSPVVAWWPDTYGELVGGPPPDDWAWCNWADIYRELKHGAPTWSCCVEQCVVPYLR